MKSKGTIMLIFIILMVVIGVTRYYYIASVHEHISTNEILEIQTWGYEEGYKRVSDEEAERIVKAFNSIKSIRRRSKGPAVEYGKAVIIKLKKGFSVEIYPGSIVKSGLLIITPNSTYSGENDELEQLLKMLSAKV